LEQKAQSEQIESEHASCRREIDGLRAQIDILSRDNEVRNNDLREVTQRFEQTSAELNVKFEEQQKEQNQAEISSRTLETTLAEIISSQKKLIEAESISCMQTTQSSDRESPERHMQLQDLESRVKAEIKTRADTIQEHKTHLEAVVCYFVRIGVPFVCLFFLNSARIEKLAHSILVGFAAQFLPKCRGE